MGAGTQVREAEWDLRPRAVVAGGVPQGLGAPWVVWIDPGVRSPRRRAPGHGPTGTTSSHPRPSFLLSLSPQSRSRPLPSGQPLFFTPDPLSSPLRQAYD